MACCSNCRVSTVFYCVLECIVLVLVVLGTAFDQYRNKHNDNKTSSSASVGDNVTNAFKDAFNNGKCVTLWGPKDKCYSGGYTLNGTKKFWSGCPDRQKRFRASEALSIISIFIIAVSVILGFLFLCCCACMRYFIFVIDLICVGTLCVTWAMVADSYNNRRGTNNTLEVAAGSALSCAALKTQDYRYGAGFGLLVAGWCLQVINCIIILLPC